MGRSTEFEMDVRIEKVAVMLMQGKKRGAILEYCGDNWDIKIAQSDNYIKRAKQVLRDESINSKSDRDLQFGISMRRLNELVKKCMAIQDYARALQAQKEINSLLALYEPQVQHVDMKHSGAIKHAHELREMSDQALEDIIAQEKRNE